MIDLHRVAFCIAKLLDFREAMSSKGSMGRSDDERQNLSNKVRFRFAVELIRERQKSVCLKYSAAKHIQILLALDAGRRENLKSSSYSAATPWRDEAWISASDRNCMPFCLKEWQIHERKTVDSIRRGRREKYPQYHVIGADEIRTAGCVGRLPVRSRSLQEAEQRDRLFNFPLGLTRCRGCDNASAT